ncbi:MAG: glycosyltransferase family protein [Sphingobacteriaceae bacterium]|nr:glycosyltransferase family protein [Sphingobacteriaceae bacterium]
MRVLLITQARMGSTRLPGKILKTVNNKTLMQTHLERAAKAQLIDHIVVATTTSSGDDVLCEVLDALQISYFRGDEHNVLDRFYQAASQYMPEFVVRLTSDCPLIDPVVIDEVVRTMFESSCDYVSNTMACTMPDGQDVEIFTFQALEKAWNEAKLLSEKEHVTPYMWKNSSFKEGKLFTSVNYNNQEDYSHVRMTLDELADFQVIQELIKKLGDGVGWKEYADCYLSDATIKGLNQAIERNTGLNKSESSDKQDSAI